MVGETKLDDDSYPMFQFLIEGFAEPFRLKMVGDILLNVRDFIPCKKLMKHALPHDIEMVGTFYSMFEISSLVRS